jgi:hypothetical protein
LLRFVRKYPCYCPARESLWITLWKTSCKTRELFGERRGQRPQTADGKKIKPPEGGFAKSPRAGLLTDLGSFAVNLNGDLQLHIGVQCHADRVLTDRLEWAVGHTDLRFRHIESLC